MNIDWIVIALLGVMEIVTLIVVFKAGVALGWKSAEQDFYNRQRRANRAKATERK